MLITLCICYRWEELDRHNPVWRADVINLESHGN